LANHKSAVKRARQSLIRRERNRAVRTQVKNAVKIVRENVTAHQTETSVEELNKAKSVIAKAAKKGVINKRAASRKISRLSLLVNTLSA
jgi:small subunit ribosomal protein S20